MSFFRVLMLILFVAVHIFSSETIVIEPIVKYKNNPLYSSGKNINISIYGNGIGEAIVKSTKCESVVFRVIDNDNMANVSITKDGNIVSQLNGISYCLADFIIGDYKIRCESKTKKSVLVNIGYIK